MNIDETTGLPELPEGYFWRIKKDIYPFAQVQIRKQGRFFSYKKYSSPLYRSSLEYPRAIVKTAEYAIESWQRQNKILGDNDVYGDYPPKKLEP